LRFLPTQPANNPSPDGQKQPKPSLYKMQLQPFFFYHTTKYSAIQKNDAQEAITIQVLSDFLNRA
jgi:hypothetical protein